MRSAHVYRRRSQLLIQPQSTTTDGVGIAEGPCLVLAADANARELGEAVRGAFAFCVERLPHPRRDEWNRVGRALLAAAGVRSWSAFEAHATLVSVALERDALSILPTLAEKKGYSPLRERERRLPLVSTAEELGQAILEALVLAAETVPEDR